MEMDGSEEFWNRNEWLGITRIFRFRSSTIILLFFIDVMNIRFRKRILELGEVFATPELPGNPRTCQDGFRNCWNWVELFPESSTAHNMFFSFSRYFFIELA